MEKRKETKERITRGDSESREDTEQERSGDNCFSTKEIYYDARSEVHETVKWVTNESDKNGNGSVDTIEPYETEHLSQVIIVVNDSTGPTNQDTEYKSQEETKAMAKSKDDSDQNDEEEFYDSHSDIEKLIGDAEMHKRDQVTQIEVEVHHGAQDGNHIATRKKVHAEVSRQESLNGSHNYIVKAIDEEKDDGKITLIGENEFVGNTEQHKPEFLIKESLNGSHNYIVKAIDEGNTAKNLL